MQISQTLERKDGSEVKITATEMHGTGLTRSFDVFVHSRQNPSQEWSLASDRPHQDWRSMSVQEYTRHGRSEMLQLVSHAEILKVICELSGDEEIDNEVERECELDMCRP